MVATCTGTGSPRTPYRGAYQRALSKTLGVEWGEADQYGNREVAGIPDELVRAFSKRAGAIDLEVERLESEGRVRTPKLVKWVPLYVKRPVTTRFTPPPRTMGRRGDWVGDCGTIDAHHVSCTPSAGQLGACTNRRDTRKLPSTCRTGATRASGWRWLVVAFRLMTWNVQNLIAGRHQGRPTHPGGPGRRDLNDGVEAATTQLLQGPLGSELETPGFARADHGDGQRMWNLALRIPVEQWFSRVFRGRRELIDHVFASRVLLGPLPDVATAAAGPATLRSVTEDPGPRSASPAPITPRWRPSSCPAESWRLAVRPPTHGPAQPCGWRQRSWRLAVRASSIGPPLWSAAPVPPVPHRGGVVDDLATSLQPWWSDLEATPTADGLHVDTAAPGHVRLD
jgi:hypothetical protein